MVIVDPGVSVTEQTEQTVVPPVLHLPLSAQSTERHQYVEVRQLKDGRMALLAYTALDRLGECCGDQQPWILLKTEELENLKVSQPFDVVVFDMAVPEQFRVDGRIA